MQINLELLLSLLADSITANACGRPHYHDGSMLRMPCDEKHPSVNIMAVRKLLEQADDYRILDL